MPVPKKKNAKKPAAKSTQKDLSGADFKKMLKSKAKIFERSKKKEAPSGYVKDEEVIKAFGLRVGKGITCKARLSSAKLVEVNNSPVVKFRFVVTSGKNKGMPLQGADIWLNLDDDEKLEKAFDSIVFILQKLGYETDELDMENIADLLEELTKAKPYCILYMNCYKVKAGKSKGQVKYGVRVNATYEPDEDDEDDEDENEDEDDESSDDDSEEDEEDSDGEDEEGEDSDDDGDSEESEGDDDEDSDSDSDEEAEEEDEEEQPDEDDPSTWVGYGVKVKVSGKTIKATVTAYNKKTKKITVEDSKGNKTDVPHTAVSDWA